MPLPPPPHPSIEEASLRAASTKGGDRHRRWPPFVDSFMDGCGEAGEAQGILKGSFHENFSATLWESCATSSQLRSNFVTNMWLLKRSASGGFSPAKIATP